MHSHTVQIETIRKCFQAGPLPGLEVMWEMAPLQRRQLVTGNGNHRDASVLLMLYPKAGSLNFPLIVRADSGPGDKHRGQIAMPGGKMEKGDISHWACALRETREELGIRDKVIEPIGRLTTHYIPVSNFRVHPFVGYLPELPRFQRQQDEVAAILEIPMEELLDPANRKQGPVSLPSGITLQDIPFFSLSEHKVWGATAMMLHEFIELFRSKAVP